jgi:chromatin remodeling complex protein RSC6
MPSQKKNTASLKNKPGKKNNAPKVVEEESPVVEEESPVVEEESPVVEEESPVVEEESPVVEDKKRGRKPKSEPKEEVPPKEKKVAVPPKEKKAAVPPKEKKVAVPPKEKKVAVPPKEKKVAVLPKEKKAAVLEDDSFLQEKKVRAPRKKVTIENYLERCEVLLELLDNEVERKKKEREKGSRVFRTVRKVVRDLKTDAPKLANSRRKVYTGEKRVSGLELKCKITPELADFMKVDRESFPSRNDITNAICAYIHIKKDEQRPQVLAWAHLNPDKKRDLQNPADRMKIVPDEKLGKLLGYDNYKLEVEKGNVRETVKNPKTQKRETVVVQDPSLKYYVVQRLIRKQIISTFKLEKPLEE